MNSKANQAKSTLTHYMRLIARQAGVNWGYDNDTEIEIVVDLIIEAAAEEAAKKVLRSLPSSIQE